MSNKTLIVAEAGVNHNGDLQMAKQLIDVAADAGADLVKFQTFSANRLVTAYAKKADYQKHTTDATESQFQMLHRLELDLEKHYILMEYCSKREVGFFSSGFDIQSVDLLLGLGQKYFKIPSGEITNLPYLRHIGALDRHILLSTGMATLGEVEAAIAALEMAGTARQNMVVLHCTTEYPAPMSEVNLRAMQSMGNALGVAVGYSDHTVGIEVSVAAVALGAQVIEKHFTLDRSLPGPDHKASLEPTELDALVKAIRNVETALGNGVKCPTPSELKNRPIARKSLVAAVPITRGEVFSMQNITAKRPGTGISPMRWDEILGRLAQRDYAANEQIDL
jgi:N,N'-diacetyllegionaminate synthase